MGEVRLRPVQVEDLDVFYRHFHIGGIEESGEHQWFGFTPDHAVRRTFQERGLLAGPDNMLSVVADDELVGRVEWLERRWGRKDTSLCWEIAVGILPGRRGKGYGTAAQRRLIAYLFAHTRAERIQATTDPGNLAEQSCLKKIGFVLEGTVRRAQWRQGRWHDQQLYSILRDEFEADRESAQGRS